MTTKKGESTLSVEDIPIPGYAKSVTLRSYRPVSKKTVAVLPIVLYFHGGSFVSGGLEEAAVPAATLANRAHAWVLSVGYSLAPDFPFPAALEDGYLAIQWAFENARAVGADPKRIGVVGHDAGGNLATCLSAVVRDRKEFELCAQVMVAPMLDPSMTRVGEDSNVARIDNVTSRCALGYRAYLKHVSQRMHPYAAPIESRRLQGLPPALIASAGNDVLHVEAERYSFELISAGVPTEVTRYKNVSHNDLATHPQVLSDVAAFLGKRLGSMSGKSVAGLQL